MSIGVQIIFEKGRQIFTAKVSRRNDCALDIKVVERFFWPRQSMVIRSFN